MPPLKRKPVKKTAPRNSRELHAKVFGDEDALQDILFQHANWPDPVRKMAELARRAQTLGNTSALNAILDCICIISCLRSRKEAWDYINDRSNPTLQQHKGLTATKPVRRPLPTEDSVGQRKPLKKVAKKKKVMKKSGRN